MRDELNRLRRDIDVLETATGLAYPFDRGDVRKIALGSLLGLPLLVWSLVGVARPPIAGIAIVVTLLAVLGLMSSASSRLAEEGGGRPAAWREHRTGLVLFLTLTAAALVYLAIAVWGGLSWEAATGTAVYIAAVGTTVPAIADRSRRYLLGGSLPTLLYGAVLPLCDDRGLMLATGLWIFVSALASAGLMHRQLRGANRVDGPH